jgi:hypothetical protein
VGIEAAMTQHVKHGIGEVSAVATTQFRVFAKECSQYRIGRQPERQGLSKRPTEQIGLAPTDRAVRTLCAARSIRPTRPRPVRGPTSL